jgi:7,8-dihydropterin-6-yl-methyl-4-(beta-D-ribofuranosyl)aminobenzene 5'-phosphate synthase
MILTTLIENLVYQRGLIAEHGLSFYLDSGATKIIFDTGQGENFIRNARQLGIDISTIDYLVISHGHFDHAGGISSFLKENSKARIIMKREALNPKYSGKYEIGMDHTEDLPFERIEFVSSARPVDENVMVMPQIDSFFTANTQKSGFFTLVDGHRVSDLFDDELFLCILNRKKLTILSSCSHKGITNIMETARKHFDLPISQVIGGFHLKAAGHEEVEHIASYLSNNGVESVGACHCTGIDAYTILKADCQSHVYYSSTGTSINIT